MNNVLILKAGLIFLFLFTACKINQPGQESQSSVIKAGNNVSNAQLLKTPENNILMWWVQENSTHGENEVAYAISDDDGKSFGPPRVIPASKGANEANGEGPPRLAVKPDGTMILVFNKPDPTPEFRFAGDVLYTQSLDGGQTWSTPTPIHSDGIRESGQGFAVLETLPNGEVAALWLDGRHKTRHSAIYWAETEGKKGFGPDRKIGGPTCQCCKNALELDNKGNLHVVYRGLENGIRDIMYMVSDYNGKTFEKPSKVNNDNWKIDACPHNGPDLAIVNDKVQAVWYTNTERAKGVYFASRAVEDSVFQHTQQISNNVLAKHLKIAALGKGNSIVVWDEKLKSTASDNMVTRIAYRLIKDSKLQKGGYLTSSEVNAYNPSLVGLKNDKMLIAWTEQRTDKKNIRYKTVKWSDLENGFITLQ